MRLNKNLFFIFAVLSASFLQASEFDLSIIEKYLNEGGDANKLTACMDQDGLVYSRFPLHIAAASGNLTLVELALQKGAKVDMQDSNYFTPLKWAAQENRKEIAETLIENGANIKGEAGTSLLGIAIDNNCLEIIEVLVAHKIPINVALPGTCHSPLSLAANYGDGEIVKFLLQKGADINYMIENSRGKVTPLLAAINGACPYEDENRDKDVVMSCTKIACKLMRYGADVNINNGVNLLERASGNYPIMKALLLWHGMVPNDNDKVFERITSDKASLIQSIKEKNFGKKGLKQLQKVEILANLNLKVKRLEEVNNILVEQVGLLKERIDINELLNKKIESLTIS